MKTLYESILDDDEQVSANAENAIAQSCKDFLSHSEFWRFCECRITGSTLYVMCKKDYRAFKRFYIAMVGDEATIDEQSGKHASISTKMLEYVNFTGCDFTIDLMLGEAPTFLANCKNCEVTLLNANDDDIKEVAKLMKNTKHNTLIISGKKRSASKFSYSDYYNLNNVDFGKCEITLYDCAHLETLKGLKVEKLVTQTWNSYNGIPASPDSIKTEHVDSILKDNDIKCFGMIDPHVQYIDWFVKNSDKYDQKPITAGAKIVPKVNG